jgi:SAM-dependent methyltransferase
MLTGEDYHLNMSVRSRDQGTRERFQRRVLGLLPPGRRILDFGAGTGIDAKVYAAAGHTVLTYDIEEAQSAYLAKHCRDEIARRTVVPVPYPPDGKFAAIVSNFAVLNLVPDLPGLFESFARLVEPDGFVLASLLNPYFPGDARYGWWRASLPGLLRSGQLEANGVRRYGPGVVARAAAPYFRLAKSYPHAALLPARRYMSLLFRPVR